MLKQIKLELENVRQEYLSEPLLMLTYKSKSQW